MREPAASNRAHAPTFAVHAMTHTATKAQIWHEMQRTREREGGHLMFWLKKDPAASPYRYRGVSVFAVSVTCSWMDTNTAIVDESGRPWLPTWGQFSAALPELAGARAGLAVSVVLDADAVAWAPSASRDAKRVALMDAAKAAWPSQIEAIRAEWLPRRKTARRAGYLAAADALQGALDFDQARGAA